MQNKQRLTIGIPAFNEEANIGYLLRDLMAQNKKSFVLNQVIVSSDGSKDGTSYEVKKIRNMKIMLLNNKKRKGNAVRQNQIIKKADGDILVLLDADIRIKDKNFLEKLILPIIKNNADLTSALVEELPVTNFIDKTLIASMRFKKKIFESLNFGDNVYTCHGRVRAFSRRLYETIKFTDSVGEDAYSYLYCKFNNFKYKYVKNAKIYYKLPDNFLDHEKQSIRFYKTQKLLKDKFGEEFVAKHYNLPVTLVVRSLIDTLFNNPYIFSYLVITAILRVKAFFVEPIEDTWSTSVSSKKLRI